MMNLIFPPSTFITVLSVLSLAGAANSGLSELRGNHLQYSKFWKPGSENQKPKKQIETRNGMLLAYIPALLAGLLSFLIFPDEDFRFLLLTSAATIHFLKRTLEVMFLHKYSGSMDLEPAITISISYFMTTTGMVYAQHLTKGIPQPSIDLKYPGILLFLIGISGNFYHHYILSNLRSNKNGKEYKIPKGGLFDLVICPHYLFEILGFLGMSLISQTLLVFSFTLGSTLFLMARSYATRKWYISKFDNFPKNVKCLIPYVY